MMREQIKGLGVMRLSGKGPPIGSERDAIDLIGDTYGQKIDLFVIPAMRLHPDFLRLRTGMAGGFLQKMQNYGFRIAIVGDIDAALAASYALGDFVRESNRIGRMLFVPDEAALHERL